MAISNATLEAFKKQVADMIVKAKDLATKVSQVDFGGSKGGTDDLQKMKDNPSLTQSGKYIRVPNGIVDGSTGELVVDTRTFAPPTPIDKGKEADEPTEDERKNAQTEAEQYYGYTLPTTQANYRYPEMEGEISDEAKKLEERAIEDYNFQLDQVARDKSALKREYEQYLTDIETGKLRAGSDFQRQEEQRLEQKRIYLEQQDMSNRRNLEALNRGWIGRGGLFSGVRQEAATDLQTQQELQQQGYLSGFEYQQQTAKTDYERAMEDYLKRQNRAGEAYQQDTASIAAQEQKLATAKERTLSDIALGKIRDIRSLQEKYQEAVGRRMSTKLSEKYY